MLVYANVFRLVGADSEDVAIHAVGGWLKRFLGFGPHPAQLRENGREFDGEVNGSRTRVKVFSATGEYPKLISWVSKTIHDENKGRQWITEIGIKSDGAEVQVSCVNRVEEQSAIAASEIEPSRPRFIKYLVENVEASSTVSFHASVVGTKIKRVGADKDSYRALKYEIERENRNTPVVLVSADSTGTYFIEPEQLQEMLVGLAQVVVIEPNSATSEAIEVLGRHHAAWNGSINILHIPTRTGYVFGKYFLAEEIRTWGRTGIFKILGWVTHNTNIIRQYDHINPHGVAQLALSRKLRAHREAISSMDDSELRQKLEEATALLDEQQGWISELEADNSSRAKDASDLQTELEQVRGDLRQKQFHIEQLEQGIKRNKTSGGDGGENEVLLRKMLSPQQPTPTECLQFVEAAFPQDVVVLDSAFKSAKRSDDFAYGRQLLDLLRKLVAEYLPKYVESGDNVARTVFGANDYAARESDTVSNSKLMKYRNFRTDDGAEIEMVQHLKIGADDDLTKTIRVHFHVDVESRKVLIGHCGEHLPLK